MFHSMILLLITLILFLSLSGIMAAVDAAIMSVTRPEISEMIVYRKWGAQRLETLKKNLTRAVVVIVLLTNTINVLGPVLVSQQAIVLYGPQAIAYTVITLTVGTIVFSEIIPKALGAHHAPQISRLSAPIIRSISLTLYPLVWGLEWFAKFLKRGRRRIGTEEQIRALVTIGRQAGLIERDEMDMIHRAFVLNDRTAADLMTPLEKVIALNASSTIRQAAEQVKRQPFSRFPVFGDTPDDPKGIAMSRDILEALADGRDEDSIKSLVRPTMIVDAQRRSDWLLVLFRDRHIHLAVVQVNKRTVGVVTLEDVLEELVGEIEDEKDVDTSLGMTPDSI